jgi:transcriptional regulator with XRE-family HTH domain
METINSRISTLRKYLGLNKTKFAQKIGVSSQHISMFEAGKAKFSETTINLICLTFGVRGEWLREGTGEMLDDEALLSERERRLLELFRQLSPKAQGMIIEYVEKLLSDEQALRGEEPTASGEGGGKTRQTG